MISEAKVLWALVNEYLSSTAGSEVLLYNKFVRTIGRHLLTFTSLGSNELLKKKYRSITNTIVFNIDTK